MTNGSDGLGPRQDPTSGRAGVQRGPAGSHGPAASGGRDFELTGVPPAILPLWSAYVVSLPRVPGAPNARRAAGDRGPWVSLPLRATPWVSPDRKSVV